MVGSGGVSGVLIACRYSTIALFDKKAEFIGHKYRLVR
jgi:hypothetical protein